MSISCAQTSPQWTAGRIFRRPRRHAGSDECGRGDERLFVQPQRQHALGISVEPCKIPRVPHYSGAKLEIQIFAYATITLYGVLFHTFPLIVLFRYVWSHDPT